MYTSWNHVLKSKLALFAGDAAITVYSALFAVLLYKGWGPRAGYRLDDSYTLMAQAPVYLFCFYVADLYETGKNFLRPRDVLGIMAGCSMSAVCAFLVYTCADGRGGGILLLYGALVFLLVTIMRMAYARLGSTGLWKKKILIAGAGLAGARLAGTIQADGCGLFQVAGFIDDDPSKKDALIRNRPVLGTSSDLAEIVRRHNIDMVVLGASDGRGAAGLWPLPTGLDRIPVVEMPALYECLTGKLPISSIDEEWWGRKTARLKNLFVYKGVKRLLDILFSLLLLAAASPLLLLSAALIKLSSEGGALYTQERVGLGGRKFTIYKLRTMYADAEKGTGAVWAKVDDPRITRVGALLRKTRIDELPQLLNVLKGEMSFVGPRPEREVFARELEGETPMFRLRLSVKPGLTGWAQVMYDYAASREQSVEKLAYDLYYIKNMSLSLDIRIILKTVRVVLLSKGH